MNSEAIYILGGGHQMPTGKANVLIVEDEDLIRALLSAILANSGYRVRSAEDGFSALAELRKEIPDILLSDLNMPGMSGFELLSVVHRRFPAMHVVATSGVFSGYRVPSGVVADAFYEKGAPVSCLLEILDSMMQPERTPSLQHTSTASAPIWISMNGHDPSGESYVTIACPECFRTFPQVLDEAIRTVHKTECVHCSGEIYYAIVQPPDSMLGLEANTGKFQPRAVSLPQRETKTSRSRAGEFDWKGVQ